MHVPGSVRGICTNTRTNILDEAGGAGDSGDQCGEKRGEENSPSMFKKILNRKRSSSSDSSDDEEREEKMKKGSLDNLRAKFERSPKKPEEGKQKSKVSGKLK